MRFAGKYFPNTIGNQIKWWEGKKIKLFGISPINCYFPGTTRSRAGRTRRRSSAGSSCTGTSSDPQGWLSN